MASMFTDSVTYSSLLSRQQRYLNRQERLSFRNVRRIKNENRAGKNY